MNNIASHFGMYLPWLETQRPGFICGIEYEIEDIKDYKKNLIEWGFSIKKDNSLRNGGLEFITKPASIPNQMEMLGILNNSLLLGKDPFTDRTSVHVHVNVSQLTLAQLNTFVVLYTLFEPIYFDFVGAERANSIFCVPLSNTYIPTVLGKGIANILKVERWHKYTAFNLSRVMEIGTVEFRHLYGTTDPEIIRPWLNLIRRLYRFVENNDTFSLKKYFLKDKGTACNLMRQIYGNLDYPEDLFFNTTLDVKAAFAE